MDFMKRTVSTLFLCVLLISSVIGQKQQQVELKIGDLIPDRQFKELVNHVKPSLRLSDFRGKLLILDFWATWCSPCISAFPKLDTLQKTFGKKIQILPVTYQDRETVQKLFSKMKSV